MINLMYIKTPTKEVFKNTLRVLFENGYRGWPTLNATTPDKREQYWKGERTCIGFEDKLITGTCEEDYYEKEGRFATTLIELGLVEPIYYVKTPTKELFVRVLDYLKANGCQHLPSVDVWDRLLDKTCICIHDADNYTGGYDREEWFVSNNYQERRIEDFMTTPKDKPQDKLDQLVESLKRMKSIKPGKSGHGFSAIVHHDGSMSIVPHSYELADSSICSKSCSEPLSYLSLRIEQWIEANEPINVGEHTVEISTDKKTIKVGCRTIPADVIDKIHSKLHS